MHTECMPHVQVRDVPDDVHRALLRRAERAGQSLQQYLSIQLVAIAQTPTVDEILDQVEASHLGEVPVASAVAALEAERARR